MVEYNSKTLAYKFKNTCIPGNLYIRKVYNQNLKGYLEPGILENDTYLKQEY